MATNSSDVVAGTNGVASQYNNLRKDVVLGINNLGTETDGATITVDWSSLTKGKVRTVTLGGNRTFVFSNVTIGQDIILRIAQDGTGSRTVTWPSGLIWPNGIPIVLSTGANKIDVVVLVCTALNTYDAFIAGQNMA